MLVVGKPGHSIYMTSSSIDVANIIKYLPGGGPSKELNAGNMSISDPAFPAAYTKNNKIKNTLLAQTMTLGLNLGVRPSLAGLVLQAGTLSTAEPDGGCGSTTPLERICNYNPVAPYNLVSVTNDYNYITFSAAVINAINGSPKTVSGLFDLANRALANVDAVAGSESGVSLGAIADAVESINSGFDECRIFVGWNVPHCPSINPAAPGGRITTPMVTEASDKLSVTAFPNPYNDNVRFVIASPVSGQGTLEVYNMLGQKIQTVYKGYIVAGRGQTIEYTVPVANRTNLIYILKVGGQQVTGKLLRID